MRLGERTGQCNGATSRREAALPKNEVPTSRLKTHPSALEHGKEWRNILPLRPKNAPSPAKHFGRRRRILRHGKAAGESIRPIQRISQYTRSKARCVVVGLARLAPICFFTAPLVVRFGILCTFIFTLWLGAGRGRIVLRAFARHNSRCSTLSSGPSALTQPPAPAAVLVFALPSPAHLQFPPVVFVTLPSIKTAQNTCLQGSKVSSSSSSSSSLPGDTLGGSVVVLSAYSLVTGRAFFFLKRLVRLSLRLFNSPATPVFTLMRLSRWSFVL